MEKNASSSMLAMSSQVASDGTKCFSHSKNMSYRKRSALMNGLVSCAKTMKTA